MRYLGSLSLTGALMVSEPGAPATLDVECYLTKGGAISASGELSAAASELRRIQRDPGVEFVSDEGLKLKLVLSDRKNPPTGGSAHVTASGDIPVYEGGSLRWPSAAEQAA